MLTLLGCASGPRVIPYAPVGGTNPNLKVSRIADPGALEFSRASLWIFRELGECRRQYLGTQALKRGDTNLYLPVGFEYLIELVSQTGNVFTGNSSVDNPSMRIYAGPKESFELDYAERDGSTSFRVFRTSVKGVRERFTGLPNMPCDKFDIDWDGPAKK